MIYLKILKISKKILITIDKTRKFDKFFWFFFDNGRLRKKYIGNLYFKLVSNILFIKSKSISFLNLYCSLIKLILFGFLKFYQFFIEMRGTGFKFELQNTTLFLKLGFSHILQKPIPAGIILYLLKSNLISLKSFDLQYVKEFCFNLKTLKLLDSYKGKGICFKQELPFLKLGKKLQTMLNKDSIIINNDISSDLVTTFLDLGIVLSIMDSIALVFGLYDAFMGEMVSLKKPNVSIVGTKPLYGMILNLGRAYTNVVVFGEARSGMQGSEVTRTKQLMSIPVTRAGLMGRVIDSLGNPIDFDTKGVNAEFIEYKRIPIDTKAEGIISRASICEPLQTGILIVDATTPIGQGQRELIIGDRKTGKTTIGIDTILTQKNNLVSCIYVAIGQKRSSIAKLVVYLKKKDVLFKTVVVSATSSEAAALQFLAPYTGCTIGESIAKKGGRSMIIYDDLTKQAVAYRQLCLILRRSPGREAFPGDVFYLHARLLERAAKFSTRYQGGAFTALPIAETQVGDIAAFVPTNLISITDGQIFLETELFNKGIRPAMNVGLSVSRVGSKAQVTAIKALAGKLKLQLAEYREVQAFSAFASELDETTQLIISNGSKLVELLKQPAGLSYSVNEEIILLFMGLFGYLETISLDLVTPNKLKFLNTWNQTNVFINFDCKKKPSMKAFSSFIEGFKTN